VLENQREELVKNLAVSNEELEDYAHVVSPLKVAFDIHSLVSFKEDNDKELSGQTLDYFSLIENKVENGLFDRRILTYAKIER
jgi:hypothetical protein